MTKGYVTVAAAAFAIATVLALAVGATLLSERSDGLSKQERSSPEIGSRLDSRQSNANRRF